MQDIVREALKNLIGASRPGSELDDRQRIARLKTLLTSYRGRYWREMGVLIAALETGVVDLLLEDQRYQVDAETIRSLASHLETKAGIDKNYSVWAVESWGEALGKLKRENTLTSNGSKIASLEQASVPEIQPVQEMVPEPPPTPQKIIPRTLVLGPGAVLELVMVPAGEFLMGSTEKDTFSFKSEYPQHVVWLNDFLIGKYPVTVNQFASFVRATGYKIEARFDSVLRGKHPMIEVNWYDCRAFCQWASRITDYDVRLPTEAEWEKAARGCDGRIWPWGDQTPNQLLCNYGGRLRRTTMVGQYSPTGDSPYGCADMAGNVWEWTNSRCLSYPYNADDGREDTEVNEDRVLRGGSYNFDEFLTRCACHVGANPILRTSQFGFRVAVGL